MCRVLLTLLKGTFLFSSNTCLGTPMVSVGWMGTTQDGWIRGSPAGFLPGYPKPRLVGGIPTPLKNMKVSWDDYSQCMAKKNVPNHQPEEYFDRKIKVSNNWILGGCPINHHLLTKQRTIE